MKKILLFILTFILFSSLIFILKNTFFGGLNDEINNNIEEKYLEPTIIQKNETIKGKDEKIDEIIIDTDDAVKIDDDIKIALKSAYNIQFNYIPDNFRNSVYNYTNIYKFFLNRPYINDKIDNLNVELHETKIDVRGRMKYHTIKLFGIEKMSFSEYLSVGIHEFAHFVDLYFLEKKVFTDISDFYYKISWESTKVLKPGLKQADFVSGYAMTNKYEDFAESFTYYILHNDDFIEKYKKSELLKEKYMFFEKYMFRKKEFIGTDYSEGNKVKGYYRDITKIDFSLKNFLIFLKK